MIHEWRKETNTHTSILHEGHTYSDDHKISIYPDNPISLGWQTQHVFSTNTWHICRQVIIVVGLVQSQLVSCQQERWAECTHMNINRNVISYHVSSGSGRGDPALFFPMCPLSQLFIRSEDKQDLILAHQGRKAGKGRKKKKPSKKNSRIHSAMQVSKAHMSAPSLNPKARTTRTACHFSGLVSCWKPTLQLYLTINTHHAGGRCSQQKSIQASNNTQSLNIVALKTGIAEPKKELPTVYQQDMQSSEHSSFQRIKVSPCT